MLSSAALPFNPAARGYHAVYRENEVNHCPGCGRTTSTVFQELADQIQTYLRDQMPIWKDQYVGVEEMKVAVMGCVVNGPGESKHADIGISLPGTGEAVQRGPHRFGIPRAGHWR